MTITSVNAVSADGTLQADGTRNYTVVYQVVTDSRSDGPATVLASGSLPTRGSFFAYGGDTDTGAWFDNKSAKLRRVDDTLKVWDVTVTYTTRPRQKCEDLDWDNPLTTPVQWSGSFAQFRAIATETAAGNPIENSAGEQFDPPLEIDDSRPTIHVQRNLATLDVNLWADYKDAVNDAPWWGLPARTIKVANITWDQEYYQSCTAYFAVRYEFHVNRDSWDFKIYDAGFRKLDGGSYYVILDPNGVPFNEPSFLDGVGAPLAAGAAPVQLEFRVYKERSFALLGVPNTIGAAS